MKKRSAFTLLELIIAVSIIAMMSLLFVMVMTHSFWSQHAVREQTQEVLNNQKQIESEIAELKSQMASGAPVNTVSIPAFKPGHSVNVVALQVGKGYDATFALVADYREPVIEVPKIADAKTTVSGFDVVHKGAPNITDKAGLRLSGSFTRKDHLTLVETYYWYASVPGFNIPVPDHLSDSDIESSGRYPRFPEQYELIPVTSRKELELASVPSTVDLAGRHVVMMVSPAGVTGKIGEPAVSRPVLITGLPIVDRLVLRLDGSFAIHQNDRAVTSVDLDRWTNLENKMTPVAQSGPTKPTHVSTDSGVSFIADRVQFKVGAGFRYAIPHISGKATAVFVAKGFVPETFFQIGARTSSGGINPQASFVKDAEKKMLSDGYTLYWKEVNLTGRADAVSIGDADVEVAEVLLFNKAFNATDRKALEDYLIAKYQPTIKGQPIDSIPDVAVEIKAKQNFDFPKVASAWLANGFMKTNVDVELVKGTFDVNTPGRYVLHGRAVDDRTKTFRLTLTVKKVPVTSVRWLDPELRLPVGTTTPVGSVAEVLPKDATYPELKYEILQGRDLVEFDPATGLIKGVKPGVAKIKATSVDDPKLSDTLTIRVFVPLPVTNGLALHLDALEFDTSFLIDPKGMGGAIKGWNDISGNAHHFYRSVQEKNVPQFVADPTVPSVRLREGPLEGAIPTILLAKKKDVMPNRPTVIFIVSKQNTDEFELISQYELESDNDRERLVSFGQERNNGTNLKVFLDDTGQTQSTEPTAAQTIHLDVVSFIPQADGRTIDITWNRRYGSALSLNHSFRYDKSALEDVDASSTSFFRLGGTNTTQSDFYEVIIFDNGLTTAETDQIINYLKTKWNF